MMFLKYTSTKGKKYSLIASQIRVPLPSLASARIWASIAGMPVTFVTARPHEDVESEIEKSQEQDTSI